MSKDGGQRISKEDRLSALPSKPEFSPGNLTSVNTTTFMCNEQSPPRTIVPQDVREVVTPVKETTPSPLQAKTMVLQTGIKEMTLVKECKDACSSEGSKEKKVALSKEK